MGEHGVESYRPGSASVATRAFASGPAHPDPGRATSALDTESGTGQVQAVGAAHAGGARRWSSRTGCRPCSAPTASWCWKDGRIVETGTPNCWRAANSMRISGRCNSPTWRKSRALRTARLRWLAMRYRRPPCGNRSNATISLSTQAPQQYPRQWPCVCSSRCRSSAWPGDGTEGAHPRKTSTSAAQLVCGARRDHARGSPARLAMALIALIATSPRATTPAHWGMGQFLSENHRALVHGRRGDGIARLAALDGGREIDAQAKNVIARADGLRRHPENAPDRLCEERTGAGIVAIAGAAGLLPEIRMIHRCRIDWRCQARCSGN